MYLLFEGKYFDKPSFDGQKFWNTVLIRSNVSRQKATLVVDAYCSMGQKLIEIECVCVFKLE